MPKVAFDIREYKKNIRDKNKDLRQKLSLERKSALDNKIFNKIISLKAYQESQMIITFVSTAIEVDTHRLIEHSLKKGKTVVVPRCIDGTRDMAFYKINSMEDLEIATFSVLEPKTDVCEKVTNYRNSICIVPGLVFDMKGNRLGYGKGYYDRFLKNYKNKTVGVCYAFCTVNKLITGRFDKPVNFLITDKYIKRTFKEELHG